MTPFDRMPGRLRSVRGHRHVGFTDKDLDRREWAFTTIMIVASLVVAVASAAASYAQQSAQAAQNAQFQRKQVEAQNDAIMSNSALANAAYINNATQLQNRQNEEGAAAFAKQHSVQLQAAKTSSTAVTAAGEAGVQGLSVNALLSDYTKQEVDYRFQSSTQVDNQRNQTEAELKSAQLSAEGRIDSVKPYMAKPVDYPSLMGAALRVGSDAAGIYGKNQDSINGWFKGNGGSGSGMGYGTIQPENAGAGMPY